MKLRVDIDSALVVMILQCVGAEVITANEAREILFIEEVTK